MAAPTHLRLAVAQLHLPVGDIAGNRERIADAMAWAEDRDVDALVLPELAITGYPPEDLLHAAAFVEENLAALTDLAAEAGEVASVVGFVDQVPAGFGSDARPRMLANAVAVCWQGEVRATYHKRLLPNYGVFDERRYFEPGSRVGGTWAIHGAQLGLLICEDVWRRDLADAQAADGAQALLIANASPFHLGKTAEREHVIIDTALRCGMPVAYAASVGGQGDVVFDGGSTIVDAAGDVVARAPLCQEALIAADVRIPDRDAAPTSSTFVCRPVPRSVRVDLDPPPRHPMTDDCEQVYTALVRALGDFVTDAEVEGVVIGVSGGVDSSLVAALAADALGPERVRGVHLPSAETPPEAATHAEELADRLGIRLDTVDMAEAVSRQHQRIEGLIDLDRLEEESRDRIVARVRATVLLAIADAERRAMLATGNKTETALGYGTVYGDMAGHIVPLKDVPKTLVYELCHWRNSVDAEDRGWVPGSDVVPKAILVKPPSARELPDTANRELPSSYAVVDAILEAHLELAQTVDDLVAAGHDQEISARVVDLVRRNAHVRQQLAPGIKVTAKAFGRDLRVPPLHRWRPTLGGMDAVEPLPPTTPQSIPWQPAPTDVWLEG